MKGRPIIQGTDDHRSMAKAMQDSPANGNAFTKAMKETGGNYEEAKKLLDNAPGNMNSPADAMKGSPADAMKGSPADAMETPAKKLTAVKTGVQLIGKGGKVLGNVAQKGGELVKKIGTKAQGFSKGAKETIDKTLKAAPSTTSKILSKAKTVGGKILKYGTVGLGGVAIGTTIGKTSENAKDKINANLSGGNKGGSKSSSGGSYSKAAKNDPNLGDYVKKRKSLKKGSAEYGANQFKINKAYYGEESAKKIQDRYNKKHGITTSTATKGRKTTTTTTKEGGPTTTRTTKVRKDGTRKKLVVDKKNVKTTDVIGGKTVKGVSDKKTKFKYDKEGTKRKSKITYKTDIDADQKTDVKGRVRRKYDAEGNLVRKKVVKKAGGRRYVTKTDAEGKETTRSRRTIKGVLTGKGKKKKEES